MGGIHERKPGSLSRDQFLSLVLPGYGIIRSGSMDPAKWSRETQLNAGIMLTTLIGGGLTACAKKVEGLPTQSWELLSPLQKIQRLELKDYPITPSFNPAYELVSTVADYYCAKTNCRLSAEQMKQRVFFVDTTNMLEQLDKKSLLKLGKPLSPSEKQELAETQLEAVISDNRVLINKELLNRRIADIITPEVQEKLGKKDPTTVAYKSILIHAFSHISQTEESIKITPPIKLESQCFRKYPTVHI